MVRTKDELLSIIKDRIGDGTSDEDISLIEDINDTYADLETRISESGDWKAKYDENDKAWREKYRDRFFSESTETGKEIPDVFDNADDGTHEALKFEDLFKEG